MQKIDMTKLRKLHERVKNHEYRKSGNHLKGYQNLLEMLLEEFWQQLKLAYPKMGGEFIYDVGYFYHEFSSNIRHIGYDHSKYYGEEAEDMNKDIVIAVEQAIGDIHAFIETGKFDSFHTFYTGNNTESICRNCRKRMDMVKNKKCPKCGQSTKGWRFGKWETYMKNGELCAREKDEKVS